MASPSASSATISIHSNGSEEDFFTLPLEYMNPTSESEPSPSMLASTHPDPLFLQAVLYNCSRLHPQRLLGRFLFGTAPNTDYKVILTPGHEYDRRDTWIHSWPPTSMADFGPDSTRSSKSPVGISSSLMEAIRARLPQNLNILHAAHANPDGLPLDILEQHAAHYLRFRPRLLSLSGLQDVATRTTLLNCMSLPQVSNLTFEEVGDRFWDGMAPFWCEEDFTPMNYFPYGDEIPSMLCAVKTGSIDILRQLMEFGADITFWTSPQFYVPDPPTPSSLAITTPLHVAIQAGDLTMLSYLLNVHHFDPNAMALVAPTRCHTH
ncbi:hypothetical protein BP5796_03023 [Coleophoma crateriformis]|uniref:Uncharacterized protein n=1 Tax=Coleophoma crateriformis TaxID=565419 RepID=A0A3D8SLV8_9HELO|nr:hypothetical protein BP5796_03023 [Coleophoma crateriformis]